MSDDLIERVDQLDRRLRVLEARTMTAPKCPVCDRTMNKVVTESLVRYYCQHEQRSVAAAMWPK